MEANVETDRQELLAAAIARRDYENIGDIEDRFAPGTKGCHEAMHVACIANDLVAERLCEHPAVLLNAEYYELADRAQRALWDLYQAIGRDHLGKGEV